jgi:hypothetical protein
VTVTTPSGTTPQVQTVTLYTYTDGPIDQPEPEGEVDGRRNVIITGRGSGGDHGADGVFQDDPALAFSRQSETQLTCDAAHRVAGRWMRVTRR